MCTKKTVSTTVKHELIHTSALKWCLCDERGRSDQRDKLSYVYLACVVIEAAGLPVGPGLIALTFDMSWCLFNSEP